MLNEAQKKAVETLDGRVLILAGAGSGKTSVLIHRIMRLIERGVEPTQILGLTFTNKAAGEMRERVAAGVGKATAKKITLSTFHSFCLFILRKEIDRLGYTKSFSIYDEKDIQRMLKSLTRDTLETKELPSMEETFRLLQSLRSRGASKLEEKNSWHGEFVESLLEQLRTSLRAYNAVDFDALLSLTVELFENHPDVLARYQDTYRYIMIDEYQDTNPVQYALAHKLAEKHRNLCVVGDDDQSIYGWRGAEVEHIIHFEADSIIKLEQNYRSTPTILHAANALIAQNTERHSKNLFSDKAPGEKIEIFHAPTEEDEAKAVIDRLVAYKERHNLKWKECAILYRSNILARSFEKALLHTLRKKGDSWVRGIPYEVRGGTELFKRSEVKDILSYLKLLCNPKDQEALLRIINVPRRGISEKTLDKVTQYQRSQSCELYALLQKIAQSDTLHEELTPQGIRGITSFINHLETARSALSTADPVEAVRSLLENINYKKAIEEDVKSDAMRQFKWDNVEACLQTLAMYKEENPNGSLQDFIAETMLDATYHQDPKNKKQLSDAVQLMTFHSAKGLEFPICFLVGLEDHIIPHEKSVLDTGIEEERRLLYVAITRAKERLILSMSRKRKRYGKDEKSAPSRFLYEIPQHFLAMSEWNFIPPKR